MSRAGWTTIAIPTDLYNDIKQNRVPQHSKSAQAYVHFWVRVGYMIDKVLEDVPEDANLMESVMKAVAGAMDEARRM